MHSCTKMIQTPQAKGKHAGLPTDQPVHVTRQKLKGISAQVTRLPVTIIILEDRQISKETTGGEESKDRCRQILYCSWNGLVPMLYGFPGMRY